MLERTISPCPKIRPEGLVHDYLGSRGGEIDAGKEWAKTRDIEGAESKKGFGQTSTMVVWWPLVATRGRDAPHSDPERRKGQLLPANTQPGCESGQARRWILFLPSASPVGGVSDSPAISFPTIYSGCVDRA